MSAPSPTAGRCAWIALASLLLLLAPRPLAAHDFSPGVLALVETAPGRFDVAWTEPVDSTGAPGGVGVVFPAPCAHEGARLDCGDVGLHGQIAFEGMHAPRMRVVVAIRRLDGLSHEEVVTGAQPHMTVPEIRSSSAPTWIRLGIEHILGGVDHLAFVLGLLLLVRQRRRLLVTITAFTVAHSITLALATLDVVRLPSAPVEATIAASVLLVAREATHDEQTLTRRAPWVVALLFGLVHGLGFAGALREIGLPADSVGGALVWFNVGVEIGQLAVVAVVLLGVRLAGARLERHRWAKPAACYAIGGLAAYWFLERTATLLRSG